jgi:hypothetical protein
MDATTATPLPFHVNDTPPTAFPAVPDPALINRIDRLCEAARANLREMAELNALAAELLVEIECRLAHEGDDP